MKLILMDYKVIDNNKNKTNLFIGPTETHTQQVPKFEDKTIEGS